MSSFTQIRSPSPDSDSSLKFEICETRRDGTAKGRKQEIGEHDKTNFKVNESYANEGVDN
jgi:hypothetical protein